MSDAIRISPPVHRASTPRPRYRLTNRGRIVFGAIPILLLVFLIIRIPGGGDLSIEGIDDGAVLGGEGATPVFRIETDLPTDEMTIFVGDRSIEPTVVAEGILSASLTGLADGEHQVRVVVPRSFPFGDVEESRSFTLDTTAPSLNVLSPTSPVAVGSSVVVQVSVDDLDATVTIDGQPASISAEGVAEQTFAEPPKGAVLVQAADDLGNTTSESVMIELALPGAPGAPPMVGVHATGWTWATPELRDPILSMIDAGVVNTVQLDLKDEGGDIWYDTDVELAHEIGAVTELWDLAEVVDDLHDRGVRVVGRIVNFRDPRLANYAVESGNTDWIIQNPDGTAYGQYGGFANPFNAEVREYNIALAEEAALLGVDDIMYDYVRRPDTLSELVYPGQDGEPSDAIVSFLADSLPRVSSAGARLGAAVFGIAATRPDEVAQDIPRMAEYLDYVAPMIYPSHWGPGEYGVDDPNNQPYDITVRSLEDFVKLTEGTRATVVSWLQDFSLGVDYGEAEVRAQIEASKAAGVDNFFLWDAATTYTRSALDPIE